MSSISSYGLDLARWSGAGLGGRGGGVGAVAVYDAYLDSLANRHARRASYDPYADTNDDATYRRSSNNASYVNLGGSLSTRIPTANKYDRFGRQLSNYDKWRLQYHQPGYLESSESSDHELPRRLISSRTSNASTLRHLRRDDDDHLSNRYLRDNINNNKSYSNITYNVGYSKSSNSYNDVANNQSGLGFASSSRGATATPSNTGRSGWRSSSGSGVALGSSSARSSSSLLGLSSSVRSKLASFEVRDVRGDGGCYYRCLSVYFTGSEAQYMRYRREVLDFIRDKMDSSMIKAEIGSRGTAKDYFSRKTRADTQDWAETTEIIATAALYNLNVHVLALVPGRRAVWEWLHFDPSIATGNNHGGAKGDIHLYNHGSVHFMLCTPK